MLQSKWKSLLPSFSVTKIEAEIRVSLWETTSHKDTSDLRDAASGIFNRPIFLLEDKVNRQRYFLFYFACLESQLLPVTLFLKTKNVF